MVANRFTFPLLKNCHINVTNTPPPPICNSILTPSPFRFAFPATDRPGPSYITYPRHQTTKIPTNHHILFHKTNKTHSNKTKFATLPIKYKLYSKFRQTFRTLFQSTQFLNPNPQNSTQNNHKIVTKHPKQNIICTPPEII